MQQGEHCQEFLRLLEPLRRPLEIYARRLLRDPSRAEDVLQDAVIAALGNFQSFERGTNFRAWMFRHVTLVAMNANRRLEPAGLDEIPADAVIDETWNPIAAEEAFDDLVADPQRMLALLDQPLVDALAQLSTAERSCLLLKSIGDFSYQEIHQMLGIPVGSVMGYLSRARRRMRGLLGHYAVEKGWQRGPVPRPGGDAHPNEPPRGEKQ